MLRFSVAVACALALVGCASTNYLSGEYGMENPDLTVTLNDGSAWWLWAHKTKQKILVSPDAAGLLGRSFVSGATWGAAGNVPPAVFDQVAEKYLAENKPGCRAIKGVPIQSKMVEYDYECAPAIVPIPPPPALAARKRR
jgi:hypothetical protein